jgi:hypothetical protein
VLPTTATATRRITDFLSTSWPRIKTRRVPSSFVAIILLPPQPLELSRRPAMVTWRRRIRRSAPSRYDIHQWTLSFGAGPFSSLFPPTTFLSSLFLPNKQPQRRQYIHDQARTWPLTNRLSKFPDAILLPILPLLLQIVVRLISAVLAAAAVAGRWRRGPISSSSSHLLFTTTTTDLLSRLFLYICICYCRMYILYLFLNYLEDHTAASWGSTSSTLSSSTSCWYQPYLQRSTLSIMSSSIDDSTYCSYRRAFDFSDHMVLYYGQILPIATAETLMMIRMAMITMTTNHDDRRRGWIVVLAVGSVLYLLYLYAIVNCAAYGTAAYFHTSAEVYVGYFIALLCITLPLAQMQCHGRYPFGPPQYPRAAPATFTTTVITEH